MKKKTWAKKEVEPREASAIQKDYADACAELGNLDYQVEALKSRKHSVRNRVNELVLENQCRRELDEKVKSDEPSQS